MSVEPEEAVTAEEAPERLFLAPDAVPHRQNQLLALGLVLGFALLHWSLGSPLHTPGEDATFPAYLYMSGVTFFTLGFGDVTPEHDGLYQPFASDGGYVTWQQIQRDFLGKGGFVRHWDEAAQSAWLWNAAERKMISYDDPQALKAKAAFVRERGLGGVMYWEQSTDPDEQLLDVVREALLATPAR